MAYGQTDKEVADAGHAGALAYVPYIGASSVYVNIQDPSYVDPDRLAWATGHESGHGVGLTHPPVNGAVPYLLGATPAQLGAYRSLSPSAALNNPDRFLEYGYGGVPE
jgi:hypothetical protein